MLLTIASISLLHIVGLAIRLWGLSRLRIAALGVGRRLLTIRIVLAIAALAVSLLLLRLATRGSLESVLRDLHS